MFRTMWHDHDRVYADVGSRFHKTYQPAIDKETGVLTLVEDATVDIYESIQSHALSCDVNYIVSRFVDTNDPTWINRRPAMYLDAEDMPHSLAEMYERVYEAEREFKALPLEVRQAFDNDMGKYFAQYGSDEFMAKIAKFNKSDPATDPVITSGGDPATDSANSSGGDSANE